MAKGTRSRSLCVPISLKNIYIRVQLEQNSAGAMVSIINSSAMLHMLLLFCDMRKITIVLATINNKRGKIMDINVVE